MGNCNSYDVCTSRRYKSVPTPEEVDVRKFVVSNLQNFTIFRAISLEDEITLNELCFMPGDDIVVQGEANVEMLYLLRSGKCVVVRREGGVEKEINVLTKGAIIGERAFLCRTTRTATVRAITQCSVVGITRTSLERALGFDSIDPDSMSPEELAVEVLGRLREMPLVQAMLSTEFVQNLSKSMKIERYLPGQQILRAGDVGDSFYFIDRGSISVVAGGTEAGADAGALVGATATPQKPSLSDSDSLTPLAEAQFSTPTSTSMLVLSPMDAHHVNLMSQLGTNASLDPFCSPQRNSPPLRATPERLAVNSVSVWGVQLVEEPNDDDDDDDDDANADADVDADSGQEEGHAEILASDEAIIEPLSRGDLNKETISNVDNLNAENSRSPIHTSNIVDDPLHEQVLSASVSDFLEYFEDRTMQSLGGFVDAKIKEGRKAGVRSQAKPLTRHHRKTKSRAPKPRILKKPAATDEEGHGTKRGAKQVDVKAVLRPNQFFGESALLDNSDGKRSASVFARTHVTLLSMRKQQFVSLMALLEDPSATI